MEASVEAVDAVGGLVDAVGGLVDAVEAAGVISPRCRGDCPDVSSVKHFPARSTG